MKRKGIVENVLRIQIKHSKILLMFMILVIFIALYIATGLKLNPDFGTLVPKDSEFNTNDRILQKSFESNDALLLLITKDENTILKNVPKDMTDERVSKYIEELRKTLVESPHVVSISNPELSNDNRYVQMVVSLSVPDKVGGFKVVLNEMYYILENVGSPPGIKTTPTGLPVLLDKVSTLLITDNLVTILITILFIFLILFWYSRSVVFSLITLATPATSLIFLAAIMVILQIDLTITLAAVGVLILGLGADYAIHISIHYSQSKKKYSNHEDALINTIKILKFPITASFITTLAGFAALIFGVSPSSQAQGIVLCLGITLIFATTFVMFPLLMTVFYKKVIIKENLFFNKILRGIGRVASIQTKFPKTTILVILILTVIMFFGAGKVEFSTSNSNWIPDDDPVSKSFRENVYAYGDSDTITIVLIANKGDLRSVATARDINKLTTLIGSNPSVDTIISPFEGIPYDSNLLFNKITNTELRNEFSHDFTVTKIRIVSQNFGSDSRGESVVLKEIQDILKRTTVYNADISLYGDIIRFNELGDSLENDAAVTTMLGLFLVFLVASILYASIYVGIIAILPIVISVIWAVGLMGFLGVPFTSLSTGIISLVLGIGVDFTIHLMDGIKRYLKKFNMQKAIEETLSTSGKAITLSSLTTFIGFMALTFAQLLGTRRLGWSLSISIISIFIISMVLVPAILTILNDKKNKKNRN